MSLQKYNNTTQINSNKANININTNNNNNNK